MNERPLDFLCASAILVFQLYAGGFQACFQLFEGMYLGIMPCGIDGIDDCDTVLINRGNGTGVVMISLEEYNSLKETEYIMFSEQTMNDIRKGEEDLKAGRGIEVNLDEL